MILTFAVDRYLILIAHFLVIKFDILILDDRLLVVIH